MNLQISFSGTQGMSSGSYPQPPKTAIQDTVPLRNGRELQNAELQGRSVSLGEEELIRSIDKAVKALQGPETTVEISVHEKTNAIMIKVLNKDTGDLIREIPPEKTLEIVAKMMEFAGLIIDERL
ncbi:flagellar protein FlaG [Paenibacillus antibioticophila]|uniref:flagellar protein FlaG n=1 Tax=Paenibacillus antibioticophila TaxID=1274374 RepID=UPI0006778E9A|nr:flagellar protein FlaG [Paenibacillus antibioticophila]